MSEAETITKALEQGLACLEELHKENAELKLEVEYLTGFIEGVSKRQETFSNELKEDIEWFLSGESNR